MKRRFAIFDLRFAICITMTLSSSLLAAEPTTQPIQQIRTWFDQLADPKADARGKAMEKLLSLNSGDLLTLRKVVEESAPLRPSQRAVLRDIVQHIYRSGIKYDADPESKGFMGVICTPTDPDPTTGVPPGVIVAEREPGFPAYRYLRPGDVIQEIEQVPGQPIDNPRILTILVRTMKPGQTIGLRIMRDGAKVRIEMPLKALPSGVDTVQQMENWRSQMETEANDFWEKSFRSVLSDELSEMDHLTIPKAAIAKPG